jgi:hypothetical protein
MTELSLRTIRRSLRDLQGRNLIRYARRRLPTGEWGRMEYQLLMQQPVATESPPSSTGQMSHLTVGHHDRRSPWPIDPSIESVDLKYGSENKHTPPAPPPGGGVGVGKTGLANRETNPDADRLSRKPEARAGTLIRSKFSLKQCTEWANFKHRTRQGIHNPGGYAKAIWRSGDDDEAMEGFFSPLFQEAAKRQPKQDCPKCNGTGTELVANAAKNCDCWKVA